MRPVLPVWYDRSVIPVIYVPPFTGLVCPHCARPIAHIVVMKRLAMVCRTCGYRWNVPGIQRSLGCTITHKFID